MTIYRYKGKIYTNQENVFDDIYEELAEDIKNIATLERALEQVYYDEVEEIEK